jgi:hypothetical protein
MRGTRERLRFPGHDKHEIVAKHEIVDNWRGGDYDAFSDPGVPKWWKWQTRHLEGVVGKPVGVQVPPSAPFFFSISPFSIDTFRPTPLP